MLVLHEVKQVVGALDLLREEEGWCFYPAYFCRWCAVGEKNQTRSQRETILRFERAQQIPDLLAARVVRLHVEHISQSVSLFHVLLTLV